MRQTVDDALKATNARDLNALLASYAEDAKIDSLAAGRKVSKSDYRTAMAQVLSGSNPPRATAGTTTIAFADATRATVRRDLRINAAPYRIDYQLEKRDGRWLIVQQDYLR